MISYREMHPHSRQTPSYYVHVRYVPCMVNTVHLYVLSLDLAITLGAGH